MARGDAESVASVQADVSLKGDVLSIEVELEIGEFESIVPATEDVVTSADTITPVSAFVHWGASHPGNWYKNDLGSSWEITKTDSVEAGFVLLVTNDQWTFGGTVYHFDGSDVQASGVTVVTQEVLDVDATVTAFGGKFEVPDVGSLPGRIEKLELSEGSGALIGKYRAYVGIRRANSSYADFDPTTKVHDPLASNTVANTECTNDTAYDAPVTTSFAGLDFVTGEATDGFDDVAMQGSYIPLLRYKLTGGDVEMKPHYGTGFLGDVEYGESQIVGDTGGYWAVLEMPRWTLPRWGQVADSVYSPYGIAYKFLSLAGSDKLLIDCVGWLPVKNYVVVNQAEVSSGNRETVVKRLPSGSLIGSINTTAAIAVHDAQPLDGEWEIPVDAAMGAVFMVRAVGGQDMDADATLKLKMRVLPRWASHRSD